MPGARSRKLGAAAALLCVAATLQGCIAVAALPVIAGGTVAGTQILKEDAEDVAYRAAENGRTPIDISGDAPGTVPPLPAAPGAETALVGHPSRSSRKRLRPSLIKAPVAGSVTPLRMSGGVPVAGRATAFNRDEELTARPDLPPRSGSAATVGTRIFGGYADFTNYVLDQTKPSRLGTKRRTVLLAQPSSLRDDRLDCGLAQRAVLLDLDPAEDIFDPAATLSVDPTLVTALAQFRRRDVDVIWISGGSAAEAGGIRRALKQTGLDPQGQDQLLLMRYADDRKQTRRRAIGADRCLIAIAGDRREDFDELYAYLRNPQDAASLEGMIGQGWFLTPTPLASEPATSGAP